MNALLRTRVAIVGAGAAGCFIAANLGKKAPGLDVTLFESGPKPMAKLAITGGGRCNITNSFEGIRSLKEAYPRGESVMKRALKEFSQEDTVRWFTDAGVPLVLQEDHCWFPRSQNAMDVVRCLERGMSYATLRLKTPVNSVIPGAPSVIPGLTGYLINGEPFDIVVITTGGAVRGVSFLQDIAIVPPVPSLFTFKVEDKGLRSLMGIVVEASLSIPGAGFKATGPLLVTDWGLSGPATLKLSSYAARYLAGCGYKAPLAINWLGLAEEETRKMLQENIGTNPQKQVKTTHILPARLWEHIVRRSGLREDIRWAELGNKGLNKLAATLTADNYFIGGKSKFREEFVTCGGVSLEEVSLSSLESKKHPGLYFAGEVLDIDAITGGFNLQAAWSTGYMVAKAITRSL